MTKYLAIGAAVAILLLGAVCYFLFERTQSLAERTGKLEESNKQLQATVNAKTQATKDRASSDAAVRRLPPDGVLDLLR